MTLIQSTWHMILRLIRQVCPHDWIAGIRTDQHYRCVLYRRCRICRVEQGRQNG